MREITVLNWQSRRATQPMDAAIKAFTNTHADCIVRQVVRPLKDFEHQSLEDISQQYDLIVFDHPFSGAIARSRCFVPLETHLADKLGHEANAQYVGPSLASYRYGGHIWGAPIDGATQNAIYRRDLLNRLGHAAPQSHVQVLELGHTARRNGLYLGTAIETPHALISILSYMANLGAPIEFDDTGITAIPENSFNEAYCAMEDVLSLSARECMGWNSIDLHEAMVVRDDIVYCPAVYGYATYGEPDLRAPLSFAGFAGIRQPFSAGAAIGGTALGLSRYSEKPELALAFIKHMLSDSVQVEIVGANCGQPASLNGWKNSKNDSRFNNFYSAVLESMKLSWVRPRFHGYVEFQRRGGQVVAQALREGGTPMLARLALQDLANELREKNDNEARESEG